MATSAIPTLIDTLVAQTTAALTDRLVTDGYGVTSDFNPNLLMIGVDDPSALDPANSADSSQTMATAGTPRSRSETGRITCAALSWSGGTDQKTVRDAAFATVAAVENLLRADPRLGLTSYPLLVMQMGDDLRLTQNQYQATEDTAGGVEALLIFTIAFEARI
jgi:hypothetical protein